MESKRASYEISFGLSGFGRPAWWLNSEEVTQSHTFSFVFVLMPIWEFFEILQLLTNYLCYCSEKMEHWFDFLVALLVYSVLSSQTWTSILLVEKHYPALFNMSSSIDSNTSSTSKVQLMEDIQLGSSVLHLAGWYGMFMVIWWKGLHHELGM